MRGVFGVGVEVSVCFTVCGGCVFGGGVEVSVFFTVCWWGGCLGEEWRLVYFLLCVGGCMFGGGVEVSVFFTVCGGVCVWGRSGG